jgi:hypothetical protein
MADISLGTFEVTVLQQMSPGSPGVPGGIPSPPTVNISLVQLTPPAGAGPASVMMSGLPQAGAAVRFTSSLTLGADYEIIMREVPPVR